MSSLSPATDAGPRKPFALVRKQAQGLRLYAVNELAVGENIGPGMALSDARAMVPGLATAPADLGADRQALHRLARWCGRYSPWVAVDLSHDEEPDGIWIDTSGCDHLFGGEAAMLQDMTERLVRAQITARLGLGPTPGAAWAVARHGGGNIVPETIVSDDRIEAALGPLPVEGLRLSHDVRTDLHRFGLRRIGDLYDLPRDALYRRFDARDRAQAVIRRLDQALGRVDEPIVPMAVPPVLRASRNFVDPIFDLPVIERVLADLLQDLMPVLEEHHQGARSLTLNAYRVDGSVFPVTVAASVASRDAGHFRRLFAERLDHVDPGFGIDLLVLAVGRVEAMKPVQKAWPAAGITMPDRQSLAPLVDRLINRFGPDRVLWREPHESHIPERAEQRRSALAGPPSRTLTWQADRPPRPLRLFTHPESVEVMAEVPDGPPVRFRWRRRLYDVRRVEGPERIGPEWWSQNEPGVRCTRDYFRVEDTTGRRFWLYRDGLYDGEARVEAPRWYVHGLFA